MRFKNQKSAVVACRLFVVWLIAACPVAGAQYSAVPNSGTPEYTYKIIHVFPHDPDAYTQGLVYHNGFLYEGTGINGRSSVRKVQLATGKVLQNINLAEDFFGEGITIFKDQILELTWKSEIGFVYNLSDFKFIRQFAYTGEGWGLTTDGKEIFMSDGSADIRVLDGDTFKEKRRITVRDDSLPVTRLNELEFVGDEIFANVWTTDRIARISPKTGKVLGWIDMTGLMNPAERQNVDAVLNGIAYDPVGKRLFVTGKLWPHLYQIQVVPKSAKPQSK